jgi:YbgC/YbaW family acyl-CoA thioester hydrolase
VTRDDFRFLERLRVRWAEIDAQHIVFNGHYLMYFDTAIAGYWRALGLPYHATMRALDGDLYVRKATLEYLGSARYDDAIHVGIRCEHIGGSSIRFACSVLRQRQALVNGELVYVFADPATQTSRPVPAALRETLQAFEAGRPMLEVKVGAWSELGVDASRIRTDVFVHEQGIAQELEWDAFDADAVHAVVYNLLRMPLATGRVFVDADATYRIGRMAVIAALRSAGLGTTLLNRLIDVARGQGAESVVLNAQSGAVPFYERSGFRVSGEAFDDAGIVHLPMVRALSGNER